MAITSKGYQGTVNYADWAVLASHLGAQYSVFGADAFRPSVGPGDREIRLGTGAAAGQGIYDVSNAVESVVGAPVSSGSRWDLVALRRDWTAADTTPVIIQGGTAKALPTTADFKRDEGLLDDQPIALARFTAGQTAAQEVIDLRVWHGDGGLYARDEAVMQYLDRIGTVVRIGDQQWSRVIDAVGSPAWRRISEDTGWVEMQKNSGWSFARAFVRRIGQIVFFRIVAQRDAGWTQGNQLAVIPAGFRPDIDYYAISSHSLGEGAEFAFFADGNVIAAKPSNGDRAITLYGSYIAGN